MKKKCKKRGNNSKTKKQFAIIIERPKRDVIKARNQYLKGLKHE